MTTIKLLGKIRKLTETGTLYAVAKKIGLPLSTVQRWDKGKGFPDAYGCLKIAEVLAIPLETVIATVEAERTKDIDQRDAWNDLLKKSRSLDRNGGSTGIGSTAGKRRSASTGGGWPA